MKLLKRIVSALRPKKTRAVSIEKEKQADKPRTLVSTGRSMGKTTAMAERRRIENLLADTLEMAVKSDTPVRFDKGEPPRLRQQQEQRESYQLYEGGPKCTVYGLDRTGVKIAQMDVDLQGRKMREAARKRADQVLVGLREARIETMEEKEIAKAISHHKGSSDMPPMPSEVDFMGLQRKE